MTKTNTLRIEAAVLDTQQLKLYKSDGSTIQIPQGDLRLKSILDKVTPQITRQGFAEIDLSDLDVKTSFSEFEEKTNGMVKLFKIAKSKLSRFFSSSATNDEYKPLEPISVGRIPGQLQNANPANDQKMAAALNEIMQHAVPVTSPKFNMDNVDKQANIVEKDNQTPKEHTSDQGSQTIIAVINDKVVAGVEKIQSQFDKAVESNNVVGMQKFLDRLGAVASKRSHSAKDLLKFMERGDLPIANDGSILIYKVLRKSGSNYVDCHTKKVPQKVGSYVCMDESLVDHNRNNECSNGLHVARRGYVGQFSGDVCVLAKLAPEDVIAVPTYDANKMRVCGYHIIFELTPAMFEKVKANRPITDTPEGRKLLADAMEGQHIGIIEEVRITLQMGGGVVVTPKGKDNPAKQPPAVTTIAETSNDPPAPKLKEVEALADVVGAGAKPVKPMEVIQETINLSRKDMAKSPYETFQRATVDAEKATALQALMDYKKQCKVAWDKLGIPNPNPEPVKQQAKQKPEVKPKATPQTKTMTQATPKKLASPREQIQTLLPKFDQATGKDKADLAHDILKIKQQAKKSWDALGVSSVQSAQIVLRTKD